MFAFRKGKYGGRGTCHRGKSKHLEFALEPFPPLDLARRIEIANCPSEIADCTVCQQRTVISLLLAEIVIAAEREGLEAFPPLDLASNIRIHWELLDLASKIERRDEPYLMIRRWLQNTVIIFCACNTRS